MIQKKSPAPPDALLISWKLLVKRRAPRALRAFSFGGAVIHFDAKQRKRDPMHPNSLDGPARKEWQKNESPEKGCQKRFPVFGRTEPSAYPDRFLARIKMTPFWIDFWPESKWPHFGKYFRPVVLDGPVKKNETRPTKFQSNSFPRPRSHGDETPTSSRRFSWI